jgi:hypothetical protein
MLWLKHGSRTFQITSFNIHFDAKSGKHQLWVTRADGANEMILSFDESYVKEYNDMLTHAVKSGERFVEV